MDARMRKRIRIRSGQQALARLWDKRRQLPEYDGPVYVERRFVGPVDPMYDLPPLPEVKRGPQDR